MFFALELILRNFDTESFGFVVLSSVTADAIGRAAFGSPAFLTLPGFNFTSPLELLLYAGLGVLSVRVGLTFIRVLYLGEDLADCLWRGASWLRPAAGGILLAAAAAARGPANVWRRLPRPAARRQRPLRVPRAARTLAAKILATSLTIWIGGSGGVFAPSLFMGACSARPTARSLINCCPAWLPPLAPTGWSGWVPCSPPPRAPITGLIIIFKLTGNYRIILPLMCAIVVAIALSNHIGKDTIYTLKLRRRGIDIDAPPLSRMAQITVADAIDTAPKPLGGRFHCRSSVKPGLASTATGRGPVASPSGCWSATSDDEG